MAAETSGQQPDDPSPAPDDGTQSAPLSVGSEGHPHNCKLPCKYHWKARGCKDGAKCVRCHICPWNSQLAKKPKAADADQEGSADDSGPDADGVRTKPKSAAQIELEERLKANSKQYEHLDDQEIEELVPKRADGQPSSIGALLHAAEKCGRCAFVASTKGCQYGIRCVFCHLEHPKRKRPCKVKRQAQSNGAGVSEPSQCKKARMSAPASPPELDEFGNSRPSWLRGDDRCDHHGPYGAPPGYGHAYGPPGSSPYGPPGGCLPHGAPPSRYPALAWRQPALENGFRHPPSNPYL